MAGISRDDWLAALQEAREAPLPESDALTIRELADLVGVSRVQMWRRVEVMVKAGTAIPTLKLIRRNTTGTMRVPAYRLVKPGKKVAHGDARR